MARTSKHWTFRLATGQGVDQALLTDWARGVVRGVAPAVVPRAAEHREVEGPGKEALERAMAVLGAAVADEHL